MQQKIVMFGSYVTDLTGTAGRLPTAGETVFADSFAMGPGGKGSNQAVAAHRAGADVTLITKLGRDPFGEAALAFYRGEGIDTGFVLLDNEKSTGVALICVDAQSGQNQIVVAPGACINITEEDIATIRQTVKSAGFLLAQFEVNMDALASVMGIAKAAGVKIVLNPAPARGLNKEILEILSMADVLTPNETEAQAITGVPVTGEESAKQAAAIMHKWGVGGVVITMGGMGAFVSDGSAAKMIPAYPVKAADTTGAGDAFSGALTAALAEGKELFAAAAFGNAAASLAVQKFGTAPALPRREEIDRVLR